MSKFLEKTLATLKDFLSPMKQKCYIYRHNKYKNVAILLKMKAPQRAVSSPKPNSLSSPHGERTLGREAPAGLMPILCQGLWHSNYPIPSGNGRHTTVMCTLYTGEKTGSLDLCSPQSSAFFPNLLAEYLSGNEKPI